MGGWINDLINSLLNAVANGLTSATQACLNWVLGMLSTTVFASPDVTGLPQVQYASGHAQLVANAFMTLIVTVVGVLAMTHGSVQDRYSLKELLPRMLIGFTVANLATPIVRAAITGGNAVTAALVGGPFTSADSFLQIRRIVVDTTTDPALFLLALVLRELAMWMLVLVMITWLGRLAALLVTAGVGPVALMCHALPQTDPVARIWWRSLGGVLAVQILQAVTLHLAVATLLTGDANLPYLGLPNDPTGLLNLLIACYLLWLVIRIPKWVARTFGGTTGRGGSILGSVVRVVVVQQLLGAVGLRGGRLLGRGGRTGAGGAGMRAPAPHLHSHQQTNSHLHQHVHLHPTAGRPSAGHPSAGRRPGAPPGAPAGAARAHSGPFSAPGLPAGPAVGRSSGTGWPPTPSRPGPIGGRPSGTGWPNDTATPTSRRSGVRRGR